MYRPSLLLPSDEYRGVDTWRIGWMCCGVLCESSIALLMSISAWVYSILEVEKDIWGTLLLPLMIFDFCVFCLGLRRLCLGYSWLLRSEIYIRLLLLYSFLFRFMTACCIILVLLEILPVSVLLIPSCFGYIGGCYLNTKAKDRYTWFRLHVWDLTVLAVCLNIFFTQEDYFQLFPRRSSSLLWPVYILCISLVGLSLLMWYILHTDATLRHDTLLRLAVSLLLHLSISLLLASLFLGRYLDEKYFLLSPRHSYDSSSERQHLHQTETVDSDLSSSLSAGASSSFSSSSFSLLKNISSSSQSLINTDTTPPLLPSLMDFLLDKKTSTPFSNDQQALKDLHGQTKTGGAWNSNSTADSSLHRRRDMRHHPSSFLRFSPPEETRNITDTFLGRKRSYYHNDIFLTPWMRTNSSSLANVSLDQGHFYPSLNMTFPSISSFMRAFNLTRWNAELQGVEGEQEERKRIRGVGEGGEHKDDMMGVLPTHHIISPTYWAVPLIFALILLQLLSGSVVIFLMASHTYMTSTPPPSSPLFVSQRDSRQEEGSATTSTSQRGQGSGRQSTDEERILLWDERREEEYREQQQAFPPLSKDMRVTLERVGHHFYRLLINCPSSASYQDKDDSHVNKNQERISPHLFRTKEGELGARREEARAKETEGRDNRSVEKKPRLSIHRASTSAGLNEVDGRVREERKKKIQGGYQAGERYTTVTSSHGGHEKGEEEKDRMKWGLTRTCEEEEEGRESDTMIEDTVCIDIDDANAQRRCDRRKATSSLREAVKPETGRHSFHDQRHRREEEENSRSSRLGEEEERKRGYMSDVVHRRAERDDSLVETFAKENNRKSESKEKVLTRRQDEMTSEDSLRFLGMGQGDEEKGGDAPEEESEEREEKREKIEGKKDRRRRTKVDIDGGDRKEEVCGYGSVLGGDKEEAIEEERKRTTEAISRRTMIEIMEEESDNNFLMTPRPSQGSDQGRRDFPRERKEQGTTSVHSTEEGEEDVDMREGMHARAHERNISSSLLCRPGFTTRRDIHSTRATEEQNEEGDGNDSHHGEDSLNPLLLPRPSRRYLSPSQHAACVVEQEQAGHEEDRDHDCIIRIPDIDSRIASIQPQRDIKEGEKDLHAHSRLSFPSHSPSSERQQVEESTSADHPGGDGRTSPTSLAGLVSAQQESHTTEEQPGLGADTSPVEPDTCMICCQQPPNAVLLYCGHGGLCFTCAQTCYRRSGCCPTCRRRVTGVVELHGEAEETSAFYATPCERSSPDEDRDNEGRSGRRRVVMTATVKDVARS
ncbi:zinc c3hc4 type (ring finger) domain-containing protein [Cystoisospora suis]|uniref:Zinc c3hc4 type (Ring finger) domain-containing protein n=1 Tax=Cystoisospora suis TaxID=483139 RepID=A0A2C6KHK1_9APIC|nr:zinc c3hc4 type (ring finger) domain-containing protein [Cystoisospora suis]